MCSAITGSPPPARRAYSPTTPVGTRSLGTNLQGNAGDVGAVFPDSSGANTLAGNGTIVVDDGAFDCDGDGLNDPNVITGAGAVRHGLHVGETVSGAVRTVRGITVQ